LRLPLIETAEARLAQLRVEVAELETFLKVARSLADFETAHQSPRRGPSRETPRNENNPSTSPPSTNEVVVNDAQEVCSRSKIAPDPTLPPVKDAKEPLKSLVARLHTEHPDWKARQIAEFTGRNLNSVSTTLVLIRASERAGAEPKCDSKGASQVNLLNDPADKSSSRLDRDDGQINRSTSRANHPNGQRSAIRINGRHLAHRKNTIYRLRDPSTGLYLHCDLEAMRGRALRLVTKAEHPWQGTAQQLRALRERLPEADRLVETIVETDEPKGGGFGWDSTRPH
jgi:hypothetical protein